MSAGLLLYGLALEKLPLGFVLAVGSSTHIVIVAILSVWFLGEKFTWLQIVGLILAVIGISLLVVQR
jgi:drug/metabolite transporter (DMT)-like permease